MNRFRFPLSAPFAALLLVVLAGCAKKVSPTGRLSGANQFSEAQFAVTLRDWNRAETPALAATKFCPDDGSYWQLLGSIEVHLAKKGSAKSAYESGLKAYKAAIKALPKDDLSRTQKAIQLTVQQIYLLVFLGRTDDAKSLLADAISDFPTEANLKNFSNSNGIDRMAADPAVKALSI